MFLLDTCALIWLANGDLDASAVRPDLIAAAKADRLLVSVTSAWEIGLLSRKRRVDFLPDPKTWFARVTSVPGLRVTAISPEIAIDSSWLPGALHGDPADRLIVATARHLGAAVVTRDRAILDYAVQGHVTTIAC